MKAFESSCSYFSKLLMQQGAILKVADSLWAGLNNFLWMLTSEYVIALWPKASVKLGLQLQHAAFLLGC